MRVTTALSKLSGFAASLLLLGAVLVVTQMVFTRYVLRGSTVWQTEFVTFSLIAATFLGCPYVLVLRGHVAVDALQKLAGRRGRFAMQLTAHVLSLCFCALLAWSGWEYFHEAWSNRWTTETVWALPLWIPLLPLPVGMGLLSLQYVAEILTLKEEPQ